MQLSDVPSVGTGLPSPMPSRCCQLIGSGRLKRNRNGELLASNGGALGGAAQAPSRSVPNRHTTVENLATLPTGRYAAPTLHGSAGGELRSLGRHHYTHVKKTRGIRSIYAIS